MLSHSVRKPFGDRLELAVCFLLLDEAGETQLEIPPQGRSRTLSFRRQPGSAPTLSSSVPLRVPEAVPAALGRISFFPPSPLFSPFRTFFPFLSFSLLFLPLYFPPSFPLPVSFRPTVALGAQSRTARRPRCTHGVRRGSGGREKRMKKLREKGEISDLCCARGWREREARKKKPL